MSENEAITVLLDECDEEGWVMGMNASGDKGFVPQNYVQMAGEGDEQAQAVSSDYNNYGMQRQDSYQSTSSYGSQQQSAAGVDQYGLYRQDSAASQGSNGIIIPPASIPASMTPIPEAAETASTSSPYYAPPVHPLEATTALEDSSEEEEEEEEEDSSFEGETESSMPPSALGPPPGLPPPGPPPPGPPRSDSGESQSRRLSISFSQSIDNCKDFCRATYDYDATGRDEITFEEGDTIRVLKRCPNGVDDGWWLGELEGRVGLFPSIVVEEISGSSGSETGASPTQASSMASPPSFSAPAPPSFSAPSGPPPPPPPPEAAALPARPTPAAPPPRPAAAPPPVPPQPHPPAAEEPDTGTMKKKQSAVPSVQVSQGR